MTNTAKFPGKQPSHIISEDQWATIEATLLLEMDRAKARELIESFAYEVRRKVEVAAPIRRKNQYKRMADLANKLNAEISGLDTDLLAPNVVLKGL